MELPKALQQFLSAPIIFDTMCFPHHYPEIGQFEDFQDGYRINANTGEDLTGLNDGDWLPEYYVICRNYFDDPFIVKIDELSKGFPVYYARHGCGRWDLEKIDENLTAFHHDLIVLKQFEQENNKEKFVAYIAENKDLNLDLWSELHSTLTESLSAEFSAENEIIDTRPWIYGKVFLTEIGSNKLKVVSFLKQHFKVSGSEALKMIHELPIEIASGAEQHCQFSLRALENIGATGQFIPDH